MLQSTFVGGGDDARKPLSFLVSILSQTVFVCVLILVPLLTSPALPTQQFVSFLLAAPSPPPPAPPALPQIAAVAAPTEVFDDRLIAPRRCPTRPKKSSTLLPNRSASLGWIDWQGAPQALATPLLEVSFRERLRHRPRDLSRSRSSRNRTLVRMVPSECARRFKRQSCFDG